MWADLAIDRFPLPTTARTIKMGLLVGLGYGLAQDGLMYLRGRTAQFEDQTESWIYKGAKNRRKMEELEQEQEQGEAEDAGQRV